MIEIIRKLSLLNEAGRVMLTTLDLDVLLEKILSLVKKVLNLNTCAILLLDPQTKELVIRKAKGYKEEVIKKFRVREGEGITGWVLKTKKSIFVPDVSKDPRYISGVKGAVSEIAAPLKFDDEVIGVLDAEGQKQDAFNEADLQLFEIFASHAAAAIRNAYLHEELAKKSKIIESRLKELSIFNQVGERLNSSLELEEILDEILRLAHEILNFESCAILLITKDGKELEIKASRGYKHAPPGARIPLDKGITGYVASSGQSLLVPDVRKDPRYIPGVDGGVCEMAVPLRVRNKIIGVLDAETRRRGGFNKHHLQLFSTFSSYATAAIQRAELYSNLKDANTLLKKHILEIEGMNRELTKYSAEINKANQNLERRVNELLTLYEASKTISSSLNLDKTLNLILRITKNIINFSSSAIKLIDEETHQMNIRACAGEWFDFSEKERERKASSFLGTPLKIGDRTIGVFELTSKKSDAFGKEERRLLETLASQAAIAIENARLFERTQKTYYETIKALAQALEARDAYTRGHSERVTKYALKIAQEYGCSEEECKLIQQAGLLHDIGKIGIEDSILKKTTPLTPEEKKKIESHTVFGDNILEPLRFLEKAQLLVRYHHEREDGSGYPEGLKSDQIPLEARIVAVADVFDALTSDRPYRKAMTNREALKELRKEGKRGKFDLKLISILEKIIEKEEKQAL
jgi:putative nucleotidyltransferase with HDIG domain